MNKIKYISLLSIMVIVLFTGCEDWLDINTDPNNPSEINIQQVLPGALSDVGDYLSIGYSNVGYVCGVYTFQISTREHYDQYGIVANSFANRTYWNSFFAGPLKDLNVLIEQATEGDNMQYAGIGKILKAFVFSQIVDIWGDVPFSQFDNKEYIAPVFDDDAEIYAALFVMIDEGIADLNNTDSENTLVPGDDDIVYGGDIDLWLRMANTLKLKLYNQVRNTSMWDATAVQTLINGDLIESGGDFMVPFGSSITPENRNPGFADEYAGNQISTYISPWFFEIMSGLNPDIHSGNADPRIPYYWCNQLTATTDPENNPEYREGYFNSIYFGSTGVNRDHAGRSSFTMVGIYPVGGKYDDGTGGAGGNANNLDQGDGTGEAPMRLITYADRLYIEAELANTMGIGDARASFEAALTASFELVDIVVNSMPSLTQTVPTLVGTADATTYMTNIMAEYDGANTTKQLEIIMTQKWIQSWGSCVDSYTDYRRTGYPVMFDPNTDPSSGGTNGSGVVPTQCTRDYVVSWPWPSSELDINNNAPAQKNITTDKVFWDVD